jgi:2-C-methyl-D-erythritol 4-phosphate cytidylyltransferase
MTPTSIPEALPRLYALVPSAGVGERAAAGGPKQYATLAGRSLLGHTLAALQQVERLTAVLVVVNPADAQHAAHLAGTGATAVAVGGATRAQTVRNGLDALLARGARATDWVLVHDAARCLITPQLIDRLIDSCAGDEVGGLLAHPLADTLKIGEGGRVAGTINRGDKWQAQTPQMFRLGMLRQALEGADESVTDESSAIEALGHAPKLVACSAENFKITWPADFALAERLLRTRP